MSTPILPTFWFHGDIVDLQTRLQAGLDETNGATVGCAKLDAATAANWAAFYKLASGYCHEPAAWINTGQQADVGQNYENQLIAWQHILNPLCPLSGPSYKKPGDDGTADISSTIKWIVAGISVVAIAYTVGQVAGTARSVEAK